VLGLGVEKFKLPTDDECSSSKRNLDTLPCHHLVTQNSCHPILRRLLTSSRPGLSHGIVVTTGASVHSEGDTWRRSIGMFGNSCPKCEILDKNRMCFSVLRARTRDQALRFAAVQWMWCNLESGAESEWNKAMAANQLDYHADSI
jgi:hypothetical protein